MQSEESTKPYLYYEQIINGIVSIPKRIQSIISDAILVKNEQHRVELEKQKQALTTRLSIEDEDDKSGDKGLFKLPLFGWFSFGDKKDQSDVAGKTLEQEISSDVAGKSLEQEISSDVAGKSLEQAPSTILAAKDVSPSNCNIRKWNL